MKLRSGKILPPPLCYTCKKFYGTSSCNWRCSRCTNNLPYLPNNSPFHTAEFQQKLNQWVEERLADKQTRRVLKWATKNTYEMGNTGELLSAVLTKLKKEHKYITAEFAEELLRRCGRDVVEKAHLILPFVIDWWNMRNFNFKSYELCYYGRYGDDPMLYIRSIPPPGPNRIISHPAQSSNLSYFNHIIV